MQKFQEKHIEIAIIDLLKAKGYQLINNYKNNWIKNRKLDEFLNEDLLRNSLFKINPNVNKQIIIEAINTLKKIYNQHLFELNYEVHKILTEGIIIQAKDFMINPTIKFLDFDNVENNIFQVCQQVVFQEGKNKRIPDIIIYINGIPLIVMELKNFASDSENASLEKALEQLGVDSGTDGYRYDIPTLFKYNAFLVISNGVISKVGTLTSDIDRFNEWKSVDGEKVYDEDYAYKTNVLINGLFDHHTLLDLLKNNIFFIKDKNGRHRKIMAQYHQYFGVKKALNNIEKALKPNGNGQAGIIWHTQGSGKSFSMLMLAKRLLTNKTLDVPTIVILTDRIDLDEQLYKTFLSAKDFLKTKPLQATSRIDLLAKINQVKQGKIILTNISKFDKDNLPKNHRNNIIVIADEAHRSHYGLNPTYKFKKNQETNEIEEVNIEYGIEKYIRDALPNATYIGFTGTPVTTKYKQTTEVFGEIIDTYDMTQSISDGSTVKIYYESKINVIKANEAKIKEIDNFYDNIIKLFDQGDELSVEKSKQEMSTQNAILENDSVVNFFAKDILNHYNDRKEILNGKAMIVCQTRNLAWKLYKAISKLDEKIKDQTILVITESNKDTQEQRSYFGNSQYRKELAKEFKKDTSKYKIAIVCDMWLTGFDVPDLDVMYFIKRLKSHNLMQAVARVNRVYPGKKYGLIVDYMNLRNSLDKALGEYTARDKTTNFQDITKCFYEDFKETLTKLNYKFASVDRQGFFNKDASTVFNAIQLGAEFILKDKNNSKESFLSDTLYLRKTYWFSLPHVSEYEEQEAHYYLVIRLYLLNLECSLSVLSTKQMNEYVVNLLNDALKGDEITALKSNNDDKEGNIINLLEKDKIETLKQSNPIDFKEMFKKSLQILIAVSGQRNDYSKQKKYSERFWKTLEELNSGDYESSQDSFATFNNLHSEIYSDEKQMQELSIFGQEKAFYDSLARDKNILQFIDDNKLKLIATEIKDVVKENNKTDWDKTKSGRARMRNAIKECLRKYNYPNNYFNQALEDIAKQVKDFFGGDEVRRKI
ncbi:hypothetical protein MBVR141_0777 [Mycoplasmopsis bovirhinis]|uniref:type I restriction endonuclease subunit R n=1 Tax=Mycoplasmopsis bovirhinis TaxID=29553 RepID=UPI000BB9E83F|nr:type I restriction endonuclease subunit R [Mycoplasmopsis bovirhinis]BBA22500.1 hypothetical protein MBVR141_0777 [Mycoplasmopsis bovirhinis]